MNISKELEAKLDTLFVFGIAAFIVLFWFLVMPA